MNRTERRRGGAPTRAQADRQRLIVYVTVGILALLLIAGVVLASRTPKVATDVQKIAPIKVGQVAPAFSAATTAGPFNIPNADHKPVLLEIFATWCPHCQRETSVLNALYEKYGSKVDFVAVSGSPYGMDETSPESQGDVFAFTQKFHSRYPIAFDGDLTVAKEYMQSGFPTIVMIGRDGKLKSIRDGEIPQAMLEKDITDALKG